MKWFKPLQTDPPVSLYRRRY